MNLQGAVDCIHLYVYAMCTVLSPLSKAPLLCLQHRILRYPVGCWCGGWSRHQPLPQGLERRVWAGDTLLFASGPGWVEEKKESANAFLLLSSHSSLHREFIPELWCPE